MLTMLKVLTSELSSIHTIALQNDFKPVLARTKQMIAPAWLKKRNVSLPNSSEDQKQLKTPEPTPKLTPQTNHPPYVEKSAKRSKTPFEHSISPQPVSDVASVNVLSSHDRSQLLSPSGSNDFASNQDTLDPASQSIEQSPVQLLTTKENIIQFLHTHSTVYFTLSVFEQETFLMDFGLALRYRGTSLSTLLQELEIMDSSYCPGKLMEMASHIPPDLFPKIDSDAFKRCTPL